MFALRTQNHYTVQSIPIIGKKVGPAAAGSAGPVATPMQIVLRLSLLAVQVI